MSQCVIDIHSGDKVTVRKNIAAVGPLRPDSGHYVVQGGWLRFPRVADSSRVTEVVLQPDDLVRVDGKAYWRVEDWVRRSYRDGAPVRRARREAVRGVRV